MHVLNFLWSVLSFALICLSLSLICQMTSEGIKQHYCPRERIKCFIISSFCLFERLCVNTIYFGKPVSPARENQMFYYCIWLVLEIVCQHYLYVAWVVSRAAHSRQREHQGHINICLMRCIVTWGLASAMISSLHNQHRPSRKEINESSADGGRVTARVAG